jgi:hypothetical protein
MGRLKMPAMKACLPGPLDPGFEGVGYQGAGWFSVRGESPLKPSGRVFREANHGSLPYLEVNYLAVGMLI